ncbi:Amiloride-sensitive sodium channel-like protein [Euroglyphus maynei]|uniref:Amiloride-sensitive sodium channel-like protein n=1 Tax=Euroglyphus maynei TaxID=6958 RepID=A0A1Y3AR06_EURMA|nr:Amiloride-sensitive sodium channel-like protein [Euroglyphus maynei]
MHATGLNTFNYMPPTNLIRLFGESSVPGVRDIALSQSFIRRMFWICSFFFFGFLALRDISQLVSEYYTYPITVDVRLRDSRRLQFPAVTVCNLNIVRYSALCNYNSSVIKDSMIPRDLREKLCGIQPPPAANVDLSMVTTTTPEPITTTLKPTTTASPTIRTTKARKKTHKGRKGHKTSTKASTRTTTAATTQLPTNAENDGMDDINTYGVASNFSDLGTNDTSLSNETDSELNVTTTLSTTTITTTTLKPLIDDIPNDIAGPIDIQLDRPKRKVKTDNMDKNSTNEKDNQSGTTKEPPAYFDNIELTEREEKELQENLTNWLAVIYNSNEKIAKQIGHQFEDLVLRCSIRSTNCAFANSFEHFFSPTEGNCFTFKSQNLRKTNLERIKDETSIAGVNYGLELVLNLEISEYLIGTAQIGAIVMIQHPDEIGNSASEAIFVAPKQSTYIGMKMVNISRLPKPFPEECIDHWPAGLVGRLTQNASYSQQACLKICLQRTIHTRCQCQSAQLPQLELNSTLKICDTRRKVTRNCVEEVMFQAEEKVGTCKCPPRCQVINYDKTVSMAKWPTREDRVTFDRGKVDMNFQNLAKVTVYFQTMTCQEVRQEKAYTTAKLFSSLGGILGMYVGFSFLSLFEIIEIFGRRFWYIVTKKNIHFRAAVQAIRAAFVLKRKKQQRKVNNLNDKNNKDVTGSSSNANNHNNGVNQRKK